MQERFSLSFDGRTIVGTLALPAAENPPYVITCHGLYSTKESDKFTEIARRYSAAGLGVVCFDFGGCGESSGSISDTTATGRLQDLTEVARFAADHPKLGERFGILGSSFGGFLALFYAARHPVDALSVWATPYLLSEIYENISEEDIKRLKEEFFSDAQKYNLSSILEKLKTVQVIQAENDEIVPYGHARDILDPIGEPKALEIIAGADHSIRDPRHREQALEAGLTWFKKHLG